MLLGKVKAWRKKARGEHDAFNRYVTIFIAYNIFYNLYARTMDPNVDLTFGDSYRATKTLDLVSDKAQLFRQIRSSIEDYANIIPVFREEYWPTIKSKDRVALSDSLKKALAEADADKALDMLIKWLYKVRCNLIHGEKGYNESAQRKLLSKSSLLLDEYLSYILALYRQRYSGSRN